MQLIFDSDNTDPVLFSQILGVFAEYYAERAAEAIQYGTTDVNPFVPPTHHVAISETARLQLDTASEDVERAAAAAAFNGALGTQIPVGDGDPAAEPISAAAAFNAAPPAIPVAPSTVAVAASPIAPAPAPAALPTPPVASTLAPAPAPLASPVPSAPAAPATPAPGVPTDTEGLPWDVRIHADTRSKIGNGTWRVKRGADDATVAAVKAELRQIMGLPTPAPVAAPTALPSANVTGYAPPPPPAAVPAPPAAIVVPAVITAAVPQAIAPIMLPNNAQEFMTAFTALMQAQKCTPEDGKNACIMNGLPGGVPNLFQKPDMAQQCMRSLCDMKAIPYTVPG